MIGKIHSLESFSKVDGPGIRYVVFMQGCNLRCSFCHNPDTWNVNGGMEIEVDELVEKILKAKPYMKKSNGGVTFSGGEPLLQADFLVEVCKKLKRHNIHIAIDTAGNFDVENEKINELFNYVDLFLFDIKHIDSSEHNLLVGTKNEKILKMATYISNVWKIPMWIRIVYLPGITDKNNALYRLRKYIATLKSVQKVDILPYHEMGIYKWEKLGIKYKLKDQRVPNADECEKISMFLNEYREQNNKNN